MMSHLGGHSLDCEKREATSSTNPSVMLLPKYETKPVEAAVDGVEDVGGGEETSLVTRWARCQHRNVEGVYKGASRFRLLHFIHFVARNSKVIHSIPFVNYIAKLIQAITE